MNYTLRQLQYVVAVADHGSVTAAANALFTSQPGISNSIAQLEEVFGIQIFIRHHAKGISVTPAGQSFIASARNLLAHAEDLTHQAHELSQALQGSIKLGCFTTIAPIFLPGLLSALRAQHPEVQVDLNEGTTESLQHGLINGQIEVALLYDLDLSPALVKEPMLSARPYVLLSKSHPLARQTSVTLASLVEEPMVLFDMPHSREYFLSMFRVRKLEPFVRYRTVNFELVRGLVASQNGYAFLNLRPAIDQSYDGSELVCLPIADEVPSLSLVLAWPEGLKPTRRVEAFITLCRSFFGRS
ncbi:LysR substrate-binding domain-containing protein [Leeia oryzae]|uniref:LysR substrate-binding domain-containing protein n=1 Tax=Leeia oryzae TaxID=356662 RepID=UPI0003632877|nr:LysR substrate-binding domain-containing protein [Leeia oryzae]